MAFIQTQTKIKGSIIEIAEAWVKSILIRYKNYRLFSKTVSELSCLSGRELSDLGISRTMINSVAYAAVYKGQDTLKKYCD